MEKVKVGLGEGIRLQAVTHAFLLFLVLALGAAQLYLATRVYFADSEIWSITLGAHLNEEWTSPWVATRPLFYGLIGLFTWPAREGWQYYGFSRIPFVLNVFAMMVLAFLLAKRLSKNFLTPWFAVGLVLANTGFINQGFRVRSDLIAGTLLLLFLHQFFRSGEEAFRRDRLRTAVFALLPVLATPKAFLQVAVFLLVSGKGLGWLKTRRHRQVVAAGTAVVAVALIVSAPLYWGSAEYFIQSFQESFAVPAYFSEKSFVYVTRILTLNPVFTALLVLRTGAWIWRSRMRRTGDRPLASFSRFVAACVAIVIFIPEKLPFFLASLLPLFCIYGALFIDDLRVLMHQGRLRLRKRVEFVTCSFLLVLCSIALLSGIWSFQENLSWNGNQKQLEAVRLLQEYHARYSAAAKAPVRFYDVIGILPDRATIRKFAGPNQPQWNQAAVDFLRSNPPELVFYVNKSRFLEPGLGQLLASGYFNFGSGVFARAYPVEVEIPGKKGRDQAIVRLGQTLERVIRDAGLPDTHEVTLEVRYNDGQRRFFFGDRTKLEAALASAGLARGAGGTVSRFTPFVPVTPGLPGSLEELFMFDAEI